MVFTRASPPSFVSIAYVKLVACAAMGRAAYGAVVVCCLAVSSHALICLVYCRVPLPQAVLGGVC